MTHDHQNTDRDTDHMADDRQPTGDGLDDRLLALALGLDDDPALRAEIERSPELGDRLRSIEADLESVEQDLHSLVPEEPEGWTDLSDERWAGLRPFVSVANEDTGRQPTRQPLWRRWQAVVPTVAAVLVAAVVFGVVAGRDALQMNDVGDGGGDAALMEKGATTGSSAAEGATAPADADAAPGFTVGGADDYGTVVVAVAEPLDGAEQPFRVERVLKGAAGETVRLQTEVDGELTPGTAALLFLDPLDELAQAEPPTVTAEDGQRTADGGEAEGEQGDDTGGEEANGAGMSALRPAPDVYLRNGETAVVVPLPPDCDPNAVRLE